MSARGTPASPAPKAEHTDFRPHHTSNEGFCGCRAPSQAGRPACLPLPRRGPGPGGRQSVLRLDIRRPPEALGSVLGADVCSRPDSQRD